MLDTVMAILGLFKQFLCQILFNFFAPSYELFIKYHTFCLQVLILIIIIQISTSTRRGESRSFARSRNISNMHILTQ